MSIELSNTTISKLYNNEKKFAYLKYAELAIITKEKYSTKFLIVTEIEESLGKDLYDFDEKDIINCFIAVADKNSINSLRSLFSICRKYVEWAVGKSLNRTGTNPFKKMKFEIDVAPMLYTKDFKEKLFTEEQVWGIEKFAKNFQDFVCLLPVFYGIKGSNSCELINLKKEDINIIDNIVKLPTKRIIHLPQKIIKIFRNSIEQNIYQRKLEPGYGVRITAELMESEYVIRPTVNNKRGYISAVSIAKRCKDILEEANYPNISINDICMSGKLDFLKYIQQKKGKQLEIEDYKKVNKHFGDGTTNYTILRELYKSIISDDELNVFSEKNLWNEVYLVDDEDNFLYENGFLNEDENEMNNSGSNNSSEGGRTETHTKHYARSRKARERCIEIYGAKCDICKFNFEETYGKVGKGLIHVHHLNQLSKNTGNHIVNAREDLRPVCPNCHLILHRRKEPFSIEEVIDMIKNNKNIPNNVPKVKEQTKLTKAI